MDWEKETFQVAKGYHIFKWVYIKDENFSGGSDKAWVDDIEFPSVGTYDVSVNNKLYEQQDQSGLILYPVPAVDRITIIFSAPDASDISIKIYNHTLLASETH